MPTWFCTWKNDGRIYSPKNVYKNRQLYLINFDSQYHFVQAVCPYVSITKFINLYNNPSTDAQHRNRCPNYNIGHNRIQFTRRLARIHTLLQLVDAQQPACNEKYADRDKNADRSKYQPDTHRMILVANKTNANNAVAIYLTQCHDHNGQNQGKRPRYQMKQGRTLIQTVSYISS